MKLKATFILLTFLTLFSLNSSGQVPVNMPKEFIETVPPKAGSDDWSVLNYSENDFVVKIIDSNIDIKKLAESDVVDVCELNILNGKLVGVNKFEKGGTLTFKPTNSATKSIEIKRGNIKFIFVYKDKIYFIEGLEHLTINNGALYELENTNENFTYKKIIDFEDAPEAFTIYHDKLLIATHANFYVVNDFKKELLFKETFWSGLYPNSIAALDEKNVFIGIRSGIVKLDLTTKTLKFYKNN